MLRITGIFLLLLSTYSEGKNIYSDEPTECLISINKDIGDPQPLILTKDMTSFVYPNSNSDNIVLNSGGSLILACPKSTLIANEIDTKQVVNVVECKAGSLMLNEQDLELDEAFCTRNPYHVARYTSRTCHESGQEIEVGFEIDDQFIRNFLICFNDTNNAVIYSSVELPANIGYGQRETSTPMIVADEFFDNVNESVDKLYTRNNQRKVINKLVGLPEDSYKYISSSNDFFLARGHVTSELDFIYLNQHRSTFHYVNIAPQWNVVNNGNWKILEDSIREHVNATAKNQFIVSGTIGIATLPHEGTDEIVELYLYIGEDGDSIPVPEAFWKVMYDPGTKEGQVFVVYNNPYAEKVEGCEDLCKNDWLKWKPNNRDAGYACCYDMNSEQLRDINGINIINMIKADIM